jgi:hypothetical protein
MNEMEERFKKLHELLKQQPPSGDIDWSEGEEWNDE